MSQSIQKQEGYIVAVTVLVSVSITETLEVSLLATYA
jgi:hypothetical protein